MTKDLNEDLIEATIRRVAEAKAAQAAAEGQEPAVCEAVEAAPDAAVEAGPDAIEPAAPVAPAVDEDRIAATMRRVAEARSAMTSGAADESVPAEHLEASNGAADAGAATRDAAPASLPRVDEDRIAATIRRVAAAREAQARAAHVPLEAEALSESHDAPTPLPARPSILPPAAGGEGWEQAVADLRRELNETQRELRALRRRLDEAEARTYAGRPDVVAPPIAKDGDDDWDDSPQLPRIPIGQTPRPAIFYDPSPQTATAEHLQPEPEPETVIDVPDLPKPLLPLHAEPKRGLDLLPRTYRITVEDKRRGVDLVPLHRALLGMDGVRDMSLLSYSNGVAIVSIEMVDELDPGALEGAVARAMSRSAKVEVHNDTTMVVKLAEE